jgi:hypothetical protein
MFHGASLRLPAMGRGDRRKVRWAKDRQRKKKAREKAQATPAAEKPAPRRRRTTRSS